MFFQVMAIFILAFLQLTASSEWDTNERVLVEKIGGPAFSKGLFEGRQKTLEHKINALYF